MKRSRKPKEFCFTLAVLGVFVLLFLATTSSAQNSLVTNTQQDLRYITTQYKAIAAEYLPGTLYEKAMDDLILKVEAMSKDEGSMAAQSLKPLIPGMLANLQTFKDALSRLYKPESQLYRAQASGQFPNAVYPNIDLGDYPNFVLTIPGNLLTSLLGVIGFFTNFQFPEWAPATLNGLPVTCLTPLDADGNPSRVADEAMMALRVSVQIAEALKEGANVLFEQVVVGVAVAGGGGNLKWLTIFPTGFYLLQKNILENYKECDAMISGAEATASYRRLGHIHDDLENLNKKADTAQGDLSSIKSALKTIETKLNTVIQLLNTPQGLRPDFPIKK